MDYGKMIKLLLPNNKFINIQISGDENELKDLLSTVIDVSPNQIKGIKDSEGNYFTLSSAIKNFNPAFKFAPQITSIMPYMKTVCRK